MDRAAAATPEDVVRRLFCALNTGQWDAAADLAQEDSLEQFRRWELCIIRAMTDGPTPAPSDLEADLRAAPEQVFERVMDHAALRVAQERRWTQGLLGVDGFDALARLAPRDLFVRWLAASYDGSIPWQDTPETPVLNRRVLGAVQEPRVGGLAAHVVYRQHDDLAQGERVAVATLWSTPAGWRIEATDTALLLPAARPDLPFLR